MPHRDTSVAVQQSINLGSKCRTWTQAKLSNKLLVKPGHNPPGSKRQMQGHKRSYPTSSYSSALNATQGFNPSYPTSYISIPNDVDDPVL